MSAFAIIIPSFQSLAGMIPCMRCSAEVYTISGGSAGCFFQLRKEIQPFILFDGHFLLHVCCSHSISWAVTIFNSLDKHDGWFSMQLEMGFKRVQKVQRVQKVVVAADAAN